MKTEQQIRIKLNAKLVLWDKLARTGFDFEQMKEVGGYIEALRWVLAQGVRI